MTSSMALAEVEKQIEFGATLLLSASSTFHLKLPGMQPVPVDREIGELVARHEVMQYTGISSDGCSCYVLKPGGSFLGAADKSTLISEAPERRYHNAQSRFSIRE